MASLIKCRKCGGPHVTLKCGKEKQDLEIVLENKFTPKLIDNEINKYNYKTHDMSKRIDKRKIAVVKISNLPDDITVSELQELVSEWGRIGRINISNYDNTTCYIDFYFQDEADYFIQAIDNTHFEHSILNVELIKKN